jgi:hypothetical protein
VGIDMNAYANAAIPTTQEWEMENDLGDSHCQSLGQGGRTPDNSPNERVVGKIFSKQNSSVSYTLFLGSPGTSLTLEFYDLAGNLIDIGGGNFATYSTSSASLSGSFTNTATRWITIKVRNTSAATAGQKCNVKVTYEAPEVVNTATATPQNTAYIWNSNGGSSDWNDCHNWESGMIPPCNDATATAVIPHAVLFMPTVPVCFTGTLIDQVSLPLELIEFKAQPRNKFIALDWKTASEHGFSGFELQRSTDGVVFEKTNWTSGKGVMENAYRYDDRQVQEGILYYYRLKMVDADGSFAYSGIRSAVLGENWGQPTVTPNPTNGRTVLSFEAPEAGSGRVEVTDSNGKSTFRRDINFEKGENKIELDLSVLRPGTYVLQFVSSTAKWNTRVVISR